MTESTENSYTEGVSYEVNNPGILTVYDRYCKEVGIDMDKAKRTISMKAPSQWNFITFNNVVQADMQVDLLRAINNDSRLIEPYDPHERAISITFVPKDIKFEIIGLRYREAEFLKQTLNQPIGLNARVDIAQSTDTDAVFVEVYTGSRDEGLLQVLVRRATTTIFGDTQNTEETT